MKKKPKKLLKSSYRKFLKIRSVYIFNKYIVYRDGRSVTNWRTDNLTCSHFVSALCAILRYSEINCHAQTATENYTHEFDPLPYSLWMIQTYGVEQLSTLKDKRGTSYKWSLTELENICINYADKLSKYDLPPNVQKNIQMVLKRIEEYNQ